MFNTYELTRKQNRYKDMKENVIKIINVLSNSDILDDLTMAQTGLKNYYVVNGNPCKNNEIKVQKEKIRDCITTLRNVLNKINNKLDDIKNDIEKAENEENKEV